jgi:hypothetical protein
MRRHGGQAQSVPKRMPWVATSSTCFPQRRGAPPAHLRGR